MPGLKNVRHRWTDALSRIGWDELEVRLASYYRAQGFAVEHCGTGRSGTRFDGGVDLRLRQEDKYILVQCKHWNAKQVPHNEVHQLMGLVMSEGASRGILITTGEFTAAAEKAAGKLGRIELIEGNALRRILGPSAESHSAGIVMPAPARPSAAAARMDSGLVVTEQSSRPRRVPSESPPSETAPLWGGWKTVLWLIALVGIWMAIRVAKDAPARRSQAHLSSSEEQAARGPVPTNKVVDPFRDVAVPAQSSPPVPDEFAPAAVEARAAVQPPVRPSGTASSSQLEVATRHREILSSSDPDFPLLSAEEQLRIYAAESDARVEKLRQRQRGGLPSWRGGEPIDPAKVIEAPSEEDKAGATMAAED